MGNSIDGNNVCSGSQNHKFGLNVGFRIAQQYIVCRAT